MARAGGTFRAVLAVHHRLWEVDAVFVAGSMVALRAVRDAGANLLCERGGDPDFRAMDSRAVAQLNRGAVYRMSASAFWAREAQGTRAVALLAARLGGGQ